MNELPLHGYHALVCGASRGIGRASSIALASRGAKITLLARNVDTLTDARHGLPRPPGVEHEVLVADLEDTSTLSSRLQSLRHPVHILVNNAGGPPGGPLLDAVPNEFRAGFERLLIASHVLTQALVPDMRLARYGRIINIISTSVREPITGLGVSNTIRGACAAWAKTLSRELASDAITVNNVLPGFTATERLEGLFSARAERERRSRAEVEEAARATVPEGRFADPREIGSAVAFLASPEAAYINGVSLAVDGGRMHSI